MRDIYLRLLGYLKAISILLRILIKYYKKISFYIIYLLKIDNIKVKKFFEIFLDHKWNRKKYISYSGNQNDLFFVFSVLSGMDIIINFLLFILDA